MSELTREQAVEVLSRYVGGQPGATQGEYLEKTEALHAVGILRASDSDGALAATRGNLLNSVRRTLQTPEGMSIELRAEEVMKALRDLQAKSHEPAAHDLKLELLTKQRDDALDLVKVMASSVEAMSLVLKVHR